MCLFWKEVNDRPYNCIPMTAGKVYYEVHCYVLQLIGQGWPPVVGDRRVHGLAFMVVHTTQLCTYTLMSFHMCGHQNCWFMRCNVFRNPKWSTEWISWQCCSTANLAVSEMYNFDPFQTNPSLWINHDWFSWNHLSFTRASLMACCMSPFIQSAFVEDVN